MSSTKWLCVSWSREELYPEAHAAAKEAGQDPPKVRFADVGCGFGGLTIRLAETFPDKLVVGMEIRDKVSGAEQMVVHKAAMGCPQRSHVMA